MMLARILVGVRAATRRMVSDWTVVAAAFATIVLAGTLLSAGPIYGEAITFSAFDRAMENAPSSESAVSIAARPFAEDFERVDAMLGEQVETAFAPTSTPVTTIGRASILELTTGDAEPALVEIWHISGIEEKAALTDGRYVDGFTDEGGSGSGGLTGGGGSRRVALGLRAPAAGIFGERYLISGTAVATRPGRGR